MIIFVTSDENRQFSWDGSDDEGLCSFYVGCRAQDLLTLSASFTHRGRYARPP